MGALEIKKGWASYSYRKEGDRFRMVPDAVFSKQTDADWYGATRRSGQMGFPYEVTYLLVDDHCYAMTLGEDVPQWLPVPFNPSVFT